METLPILAIACIAVVIGMLMVFESGKDPEKYGKIGLPGALLPGTLFVLAAGVYNFVILIGVMF